VYSGKSGHLFGDGEAAFQWPFYEDGFSGDEAGADGGKVSIYARTYYYEVDCWVCGKI
jgi:hypothetical protein